MRTLPRMARVLLIAVMLMAPLALNPSRPAAAKSQSYAIAALPTLGGREAAATDIDAAGRIVGWAATTDGEEHAALWVDGKITDLGTLGGKTSMATAIGPSGLVVGEAETASDESHAVLWKAGQPIDLGTLGGSKSRATAINAAGVIAGWALADGGSAHAVTWMNGAIHDLGVFGGEESKAYDINDDGRVAGSAAIFGAIPHAAVWTNGVAADLGTLGGLESVATAISSDGIVVGFSDTPDRLDQGFRWEQRAFTVLPSLNENGWAMPIDVNDSGLIAGTASTAADSSGFPVIWVGDAIIALPTLGGHGSATGVNEAGALVGWADDSDGVRHAVVWSFAPARSATPAATPSSAAALTITLRDHEVTLTSVSIPAGETAIVRVVNEDPVDHRCEFTFPDDTLVIVANANQTTYFQVKLPPNEIITFICSTNGAAEPGMTGAISALGANSTSSAGR